MCSIEAYYMLHLTVNEDVSSGGVRLLINGSTMDALK